ncbi:alpha/beta fold hydrolase [Xylophilus sp. Kf1]|nr:alpha/beta fold hydrolase [Xylophilus sp. Kf1]
MTIRSRLVFSSIALAFAATGAFAQDAAKPSVVIVHGAFADGSDWARVIPLLQAKGVDVVAVQNPLTSLEDDVAATKRALDLQPGKVVLVGHSWGGVVITQAGDDPKVSSLVYVAALAPDAGQSGGELGKAFPPAPGFAHIRADSAGYLRMTPDGIARHFAQDVPAKTTAVMAATQGPVNGKAFEQQVTVAAWKNKPSWYVVASQDHMIQPDQQVAMAKAIGARVTVLPTSHVPQQSQPAKVAAVILDAVNHAK